MFDVRTVTTANAAELAEWCGGRLVTEINDEDPSKTQPGINVPVGSEVMRASVGDVIIGKDGLFMVRKY